MLTVYNRTFMTRNAQYSFARQLQVDLVLKVLRATDLYAAADFYASFLEEYTDEFMPDFEHDYEDEDGEPCNAFRYKSEAAVGLPHRGSTRPFGISRQDTQPR